MEENFQTAFYLALDNEAIRYLYLHLLLLTALV